MVPLTCSQWNAARAQPVVLAALVFAGCGTQAPDQSAACLQGSAQADSAFYLHQLQQSADDSKTNWQLLAIHALLNEGKSQQAVDLVNHIPQNLNDTHPPEQSLLAVTITVAQKNDARHP
ncbi:penicillin-binding protein activator, partial [Salmonella enterica]|uniref:penicillin-binding protein activator n=1 Tax=Salmonella enterica TaxID=28901 RepID=UPI00398C7654